MTAQIECLPPVYYSRAFQVLEDCDSAESLEEFQDLLLNSLSSVFGFEHVTCFAGTSLADAFDDRSPLLRGRTVQCFEEYSERWYGRDVLAVSESKQSLVTTGFSQLGQLSHLPDWGRPYVDEYLRRWGLQTASAMHLQYPGGGHALIGIFDPDPNLIGPDEATILRLLARHLSALSRRMPRASHTLPELSDRLREVATRICAGHSNAQIARELHLGIDTIKKYVSRILAATESTSRAEFIARYRCA